MDLADAFETVRDTLLRHLPRAAATSVVTLDEDGLQVAEPGVSIGDLALMLQELTGAAEFLPAGLPVADIRLQKLSLARGLGDTPDLDFTLRWGMGKDRASLALAGAFALRLGEVVFSMHGGRLSAIATVGFDLDDLALDVSFELPSQVIELRLEPAQLAGAAGFLAERGLVTKGAAAKLNELVIRGSLVFEHLVVYVELEDLFSLGPVTLSYAAAEVDLAGGGGSSLAAQAEVRIALANRPDLVIDAECEVDAAGWRVAGSLAMAGGGLTISDLATSFAAAFQQPAPSLPAVLAKLGLAQLAVALDTHDQTFRIDVTLDWQHDAEIVVHFEKSSAGLRIAGSLTLGGVVFKVDFDQAGGSVLMASFDAAGSTPLSLDQLLVALSVTNPSAAGGLGASLGVRSMALALDDQARLLVAAEVDAGIDLSRLGELPLVGSLLPKGEPLGLTVTPYFMADQFAAAVAARALMPASLGLPATLASGPHVALALQLGGKPITLDALGQNLAAAQAPALPPAGAAGGAVAAGSGSGADAGLKWTDVKKTLGPLSIRRIGYAADKTAVDLAIDAAMDLAGLTVSVDGLGARYELATRTLTPRLRGLGLDLKSGPLEIGGAFLNVDGDFLGKVTIAARQFSLNAVGGFSMIEGTPSMFAFGVLDMPIGGPAFFFVEGLAAGAGLHRSLRQPTIEQVRDFPLISVAGVKQTKPPDASAQLRALHDFVTPRLGEYFVAAGIKFNSFRLLHGFALLVVTFGRDFAIDLIGTADFASPPDLPANVPALARIQLDLLARVLPAEGLVAVEARLDPRSYVYGPLCLLSGGFAFYAWTAGRHAGDFVLSVGGYHPDYDKPEHYPAVPRVELKYQVSSEVYLKGEAYFALTPSIMMAGGALHAQATIGSLQAWADFSMDFWVAWEPFHYDARLHIGIGAQWKCFHTTASVDLRIWGPEFSGSAHVEWYLFSFDLQFGPQSPSLPVPISVAKFMKSFLDVDAASQDSQDATLGIVLTQGVVGDVVGTPVVAPAGLVICTSSRVPATSAALGGIDLHIAAPALGMAPAAVNALASSHAIKVQRRDGTTLIDASADFIATPLQTGFPAALWGAGPVLRNAAPIVAISGVELRPAQPPTPGRTQSMRVDQLAYEVAVVKALRVSQGATTEPAAVPTRLPRADLAALGLDTPTLVDVAPPTGRAQILLGDAIPEAAGV
jgi:hypothetical protein